MLLTNSFSGVYVRLVYCSVGDTLTCLTHTTLIFKQTNKLVLLILYFYYYLQNVSNTIQYNNNLGYPVKTVK